MCERSDAFAHFQMDERSDAFECANAPTRSLTRTYKKDTTERNHHSTVDDDVRGGWVFLQNLSLFSEHIDAFACANASMRSPSFVTLFSFVTFFRKKIFFFAQKSERSDAFAHMCERSDPFAQRKYKKDTTQLQIILLVMTTSEEVLSKRHRIFTV